MDNYDFLTLFLQHTVPYLFIVSALGFVYFLIFRKTVHGIADPLFLSLLFSVFALSVAVFLYYTESISFYLFSSLMLTQACFFLGFFSLRRINFFKNIPYKSRTLVNSDFSRVLFFILSSAEFIALQTFTYIQKGIPIFYESRLEYYEGGSGFGIFSRFLDVLTITSFYSFIDLLANKRLSKSYLLAGYATFYACAIFAYFMLSGSKSAFLTLLFVTFTYFLLQNKLDKFHSVWKRNRKTIIVGSIAAALAIVFIQSAKNDDPATLNAGLALGYRLISTGDIFWYAYPNNLIYSYSANINGFEMLFNDLLGFLRVYNWDELRFHPGEYFYKLHHYSDITQGANARHNIFGFIYFGYVGALVFSFILGIIFSFCRFQLPKLHSYRGIFISSFVCYFFIKACSIEGDPTLFFTYVTNAFISFCLTLPIYLCLYSFLSTKRGYV